MPVFKHGKNTVFKIASVGTPTVVTDISNVCRSVSLPRQADTADTTAFGSTQKTYVVGIPGGNMSFEGAFDVTVDGQLAALVGFETPLAWEWYPGNNVTGQPKYSQPGGTGNAGMLISSYDVTSPVGDLVSFKCDCLASGAITRAIV